MKTIRVVAAVICDDLNRPTQVFATARGCCKMHRMCDIMTPTNRNL